MKTTGTIKPSSKHLIQNLLSGIDFSRAACIVEFGPGDGCITEALVEKLKPGSRILSLEINEAFHGLCTDKFAGQDQIGIYMHSAFDFDQLLKAEGIDQVDYFVSSLPLSFFDNKDTRDLLGKAKRHLAPHGAFVQYMYSLHKYRLLRQSFDRVQIRFTLRNIPPAFVFHCR